MGWKTVKEHYRIGHIVQVASEGVCIGSSYIHDLIIIGFDGNFIKKDDGYANDDLARYQREMLADMPKLKELIDTPDTFEKSIAIWTYNGAEIIKKQCEIPEWPNVTHDGQLIYGNMFSTDRSKVVGWAKENAESHRRLVGERLKEAHQRVAEIEEMMAEADSRIATLTQESD